jgi:uncharacterized protein YkwD
MQQLKAKQATADYTAEITETIAYLTKHKGNLPIVKQSKPLVAAAQDHLIDISKNGIKSHTSSDGKTNYMQRIQKHALVGGAIFEVIFYQNQLQTP